MEYGKMVEATFLRRVNRFTAFVELNGQEEMVHVKNTGR
ncbi:MAG: DNA/RNA nuclease SfsA, partial [Anaerotignum sp.]|nr:DNA/RNA nuclease SfsA [Anaerotignum sp.]